MSTQLDAPAREALAHARGNRGTGALNTRAPGACADRLEIDQRTEADYRWFRFEAPTSCSTRSTTT